MIAALRQDARPAKVCATCRHWVTSADTDGDVVFFAPHRRDGWRCCALTESRARDGVAVSLRVTTAFAIDADDDAAILHTAHDFGCTQHEANE